MADDTGVDGIDELDASLRGLGEYLDKGAKEIDRRAVDDMANLARSRAPERTGLLLNGIRTDIEDGDFVFEASAKRASPTGKEEEDYAHFVEFGTSAGSRGQTIVAGDAFFAGSGRGRTRRQYRTHPGTPAQPFFYNSASEVLEQRNRDLSEFIGAAGDQYGFGD
ncbi:HK97 gp10 family phage protein [Rhodoblastus acidophilus]|uniref:HK97 gp10 family phage protein n=1 Tax=Rhodoblastus acidophilus TaxID=1074 RepID=UPI0022259108|nr:HK97 gp10 family phage protein [Rhodoblastus acidophilus]MCW2315311.1 HK97 gp10 family phage protein [Rhodoblastus acidophilus]